MGQVAAVLFESVQYGLGLSDVVADPLAVDKGEQNAYDTANVAMQGLCEVCSWTEHSVPHARSRPSTSSCTTAPFTVFISVDKLPREALKCGKSVQDTVVQSGERDVY